MAKYFILVNSVWSRGQLKAILFGRQRSPRLLFV